MRTLVRYTCAVLLAIGYIFFWRTLFKDTIHSGNPLEVEIRRSTLVFAEPFSLEAGSCEYFIITAPQDASLVSQQTEKPVGVGCSGQRYFVASNENAPAGKWSMEIGAAHIRATGLDGGEVVATEINDESLDVLKAVVGFFLSC
ncbi:MAG: hypothetical protein UZ21_OP11001000708 [Microgenomates bacterium OLB22]|nr:MAG: hypothetical protein UZ21_OP11001000708 [Microgenomates bacterium OLB22]